MRKFHLVFLVTACCGLGQPPVPVFPPDLMQYLGLTQDQVMKMVTLKGDYSQTTMQRSLRMSQVQQEIREETAKTDLDPMALGVRYAELEAIRRELSDLQKQLRQNLAATLNDAQRAKLKALDDAMKLQPLIAAAQCENLLDAPVALPISTVLTFTMGDFTTIPVIGGISFSCSQVGILPVARPNLP
jgi:hypothetical protein